MTIPGVTLFLLGPIILSTSIEIGVKVVSGAAALVDAFSVGFEDSVVLRAFFFGLGAGTYSPVPYLITFEKYFWACERAYHVGEQVAR